MVKLSRCCQVSTKITPVVVFLLFGLAQPMHRLFAQGSFLEVQAVVRGSARLPCNISSPLRDDSILLVVWYKNEKKPIYSYDQRLKKSQHWMDKEVLSDRAYFQTMSEPAILSLDNVEESDEAEYRCRVDFKKSPTRNYKVRLNVAVPPGQPTILNERNKEIQMKAGPYIEGTELKLTCIVRGGKPAPTVQWWRGGALVDSMDVRATLDTRHSQLIVRHLTRDDLGSEYTCTANNNNISNPVSAKIQVEMHLKPLKAQILSSFQPLSVDRSVNITCQSIGSRPPAKLSWWIDGKRLEPFWEDESKDGNVSTSMVRLTATVDDNGKTLTCRADNTEIKGSAEEDFWKLNVYFLPVLELKLGSNLNPDDIEEGDDVYFECKVHSNPGAYKVVWKHNGHTVQHNQKTGVIISHNALALQHVKRYQAGNYTCVASNVEGDGESNSTQLKVMYKPVCRSDQKRVYGVARHEKVQILCQVDSFPLPDEFKWTFNNSASENVEVAPERYLSTPSISVSQLSYEPVTELDYGTVMCWAANTAGQQTEPCLFHIMPAGKPDSPYNCTLMNQTTDSLEVECAEGFNGGQRQQFQLEVYQLQTNILLENKTSSLPSFVVGNLAPGQLLKMIIYATNSKGRSDQISMEGFTLKVAEKQTGSPVQFELTPFVGVIVMASTLICVAGVIIFASLKARSRSRCVISRPQALPIKDKATLPLRSHVQDLYDMDDKNPDLIPCNKDSEYQLGTPGQNQTMLVDSCGGQSATQQSVALPSYEDTIPRNNIITRNGDIYDNYKNKYTQQQQNIQQSKAAQGEEVTYAELCLARPTSLDGATASEMVAQRGEPTIYSEIDIGRRAPGAPSGPGLLVSPGTHREIVTVRTPLMANAQESCV
ncbi:nephrin [Nilaparvata lugens]|uniref:nephrin n=1 Tax=Nilaparvata lugens TaxID=108931 RepID=UPI00193C9DB4|nr:nephrin [Nilaparvata lugens]